MSGYISKEDISRVLLERTGANESCLSNARELKNHEAEQYFNKLVFEDEQIVSLIEELSPADVRENKRGHWEEDNGYGLPYHCSICGSGGLKFWNFCRDCGADMREPKDIIHKAIDNTIFAEEAYPNIKEELHKAVDMAEPKGEKGD